MQFVFNPVNTCRHVAQFLGDFFFIDTTSLDRLQIKVKENSPAHQLRTCDFVLVLPSTVSKRFRRTNLTLKAYNNPGDNFNLTVADADIVSRERYYQELTSLTVCSDIQNNGFANYNDLTLHTVILRDILNKLVSFATEKDVSYLQLFHQFFRG